MLQDVDVHCSRKTPVINSSDFSPQTPHTTRTLNTTLTLALTNSIVLESSTGKKSYIFLKIPLFLFNAISLSINEDRKAAETKQCTERFGVWHSEQCIYNE